MPIQVKLVLPDNLNSTFLRGEFINRGETYFTGKLHADPSVNGNKNTLVFGFELADTATRQPIALKRIVDLVISNDPQFDSSAALHVYNLIYADNTVYRVNLNPLYFFDPTANGLEINREVVATTTPQRGYFEVTGWPLSANGGLSTVYFRATVEDINGAQGTYPESYGIYDQIYWQAELGSTPGLPVAVQQADWVGRRTQWRFKGAEESATGLYGNGVANYDGDIIEIRNNSIISNINGITPLESLDDIVVGSPTTAVVDSHTINLSVSAPTGGTGPYTYQWERSTTAGFQPGPVSIQLESGMAGGVFNPPSLVFVPNGSSTPTNQTFTYTATSGGVKNIIGVNDQGLNNSAPATFTATSLDSTASTQIFTGQSYRFVAPGLLADTLSANAYTFTGSGYTSAGNTFNSNITVNTTGAAFYSVEKLTTSVSNPDLVATANVMTTPAQANVNTTVRLKIYRIDLANNFSSNADECVMEVNFGESVVPTARLYRNINSVKWNSYEQVTTLPDRATKALLAGGNFELFFSQCASNDAKLVVKAYFTSNTNDETFLLGSDVVPGFLTQAPWSLGTAVEALAANGDTTFRCRELALASGRFLLGVDLGDCQQNDADGSLFPTTITSNWSAAVGNTADWKSFTEAGGGVTTSSTLTLNAPVDTINNQRSVAEIQANLPTFSGRARVDLDATSITGELYVAFSPEPVYTPSPTPINWPSTSPRPMGTRCNTEIQNASEPLLKPTVLVAFNASARQVIVAQRLSDNTITCKPLYPYAPNSNDHWSVEINSLRRSVADDGTWVVVRRNNEVVGVERLQQALPTAPNGLGFYVAVGVRADHNNTTTPPVPQAGHAVLTTVKVYGLPATDPAEADSYRQFNKANSAAMQDKPLLGQNFISGLTDQGSFGFKATLAPHQYFAQKIKVGTLSSFFSGLSPLLLELKVRALGTGQHPSAPRVTFYQISTDGGIDKDHPLIYDTTTSTTPYWIEASLFPPLLVTGRAVPHNQLLQYTLNVPAGIQPFSVVGNHEYWLVIELPQNMELATANTKNEHLCTEFFTYSNGDNLAGVVLDDDDVPVPGTGWIETHSVWFKLFSHYRKRGDNTVNMAVQQTRLAAKSHAQLYSMYTPLSTEVAVDLQPPDAASLGITGRPVVHTITLPTVRSIMLEITAEDDKSGVKAFRVGKQCDYGAVFFGDWQPAHGYSVDDKIIYTVYEYGTWPLLPTGGVNTVIADMNGGSQGARKVWVQTMDAVGNISEAYPFTVLAQSLALVDTVPPKGRLAFVNGENGTVATVYNGISKSWLSLAGSDRVSGIKDVRFRPKGGPTWEAWRPFAEYVKYSLAVGDGIKRIEAQCRDYGNNAEQIAPLWDLLYKSSNKNTIFVAMTNWTKPGDTTETLYLSGIHAETFNNLSVVDSVDPAYAGNTAFYCYNSALGRKVLVRGGDQLTVVVNSTTWTRFTPASTSNPCSGAPSNGYYVDEDRGLIVFCTALPTNPTIVVTVKRQSAVIYSWDGQMVLRVADLGYYKEKVVLSMCPSTNYLYFGGGSGNIWKYDGQVVTGPVYLTADNSINLPVTALAVHQFAHENEPYLYAATAQKPRLFRAPTATAHISSHWNIVANTDYLAGNTGDITCMASAYDLLFLGTNASKILRYERRLVRADRLDEEESLSVSTLHTTDLGEGEGVNLPVSALLTSGRQVWAGIGDRPEVWAYSQTLRPELASVEDWSTQKFTRMFSSDTAPWQFYTNQGVTTTRNQTNLGWASITDPYTASGYRDLITLAGVTNDATQLKLSTGSDWEQAVNNKTQWTVEMDALLVAGSGSQGIQICDGRYFLQFDLSGTAVTLTSGTNSVTRNLSEVVVSAFQQGGLVYPERGVSRLWNFTSGPASQDHGPYWTGDTANTATGDVQNWTIGQLVATLAVDKETETSGSFSRTTHFLKITPMATGNPRVQWEAPSGDAGITVNTQSKVMIRARVTPADATLDWDGATVRVACSDGSEINSEFTRWYTVPVQAGVDFQTYEFFPCWTGNIKEIALEWSFNANHATRIDVDYVAITTDAPGAAFVDNLTPVRIAVDDTRVMVWVGMAELPLIDMSDFLLLPTTDISIVFGKIDLAASSSTWGWGGLRFITGTVVAPMVREEKDFTLGWRFPSAGGVRSLVNYQGTAWALTDGIYQMRRGDNPDDRAAKAFSYYPDQQVWQQENPPYPRTTDGKSIVRPLAAATYHGNLLVTGQQGNIRYATTNPNPDAPGYLSASPITSTRIDLFWVDNSTGETNFSVERSADGTSYSVIGTAAANAISFSDTSGVSADTTYYYRVRAYYGGSSYSAYSNVAVTTSLPAAPTAPSGLTLTPLSNVEIDVAWTDASSTESGFHIYRSLDNTTFTLVGTTGANTTIFHDTGLQTLTTYYYRVASYNVGGESSTISGSTTTHPAPPAVPSGLSLTVVSQSQIDLDWTDNAGNETGFKVERSLNGTSWSVVATIATPDTEQYSDNGLTSSTLYYYRVRSYNVGGSSAPSNVASATTLTDPPVAPSALTATTVSNSRIDLQFNDNSNNETGFVVQRSTDNVTFTDLVTLGANTAGPTVNWSDIGLTSSTLYYYKVRAYNSGGNSSYSNTASATTLIGPPNAPTGLTAVPTYAAKNVLSWTDNSSNETGFRIERQTPGSSFTEIATVSAGITTYENTSLTPGSVFYYRVRAYNAGGNSAYSNIALANMNGLPVAPSNLTAQVVRVGSAPQVQLSWQDNANNESNYVIELYNGSTWDILATVGGDPGVYSYITYNHNPVTIGTTYTYRVKAINDGGDSLYSNTASATVPTIPAQPTLLTVTPATSSRLDLAWTDNATNETNYTIERSLNGTTGWTIITSTLPANSNTFSDTGLTANTAYYYRVTATNASGDSAPSSVANASTFDNAPFAPTALLATPNSGGTAAILTWTDNSSNETSFKAEYSIGSGFSAAGTVSANTTTVSHTIDANTYKAYRVYAENAGGVSGYSNLAYILNKQVTVEAFCTGPNQIDIVWSNDNTNSAGGYEVQRQLNSGGSWATVATTNSVSTTIYTDTGVTTGTTYDYRVRSFIKDTYGNTVGYSNYTTVTGISCTLPTYYDNFTRVNSTSSLGSLASGQAWTAAAGTFGIDTNRGYVATSVAAGQQNIAQFTSTLANATIGIRPTVYQNALGGDPLTPLIKLIFRYTDSSNYWTADFYVGIYGYVSLDKVVAGVRHQMALWSNQGDIFDNDIIRVITSGNNITVKVNATTVLTLTDSFNASAVKHGWGANSSRATGHRVDDFFVK